MSLRLIAPEVAERVADRMPSPGLTSREVGVLELVAHGVVTMFCHAMVLPDETTFGDPEFCTGPLKGLA